MSGMSMGEEAAQEAMVEAAGEESGNVPHLTPAELAAAATAKPAVPETDGITVAQAEKQAATLRRAARACPVRQLRYLLHRLAREWELAAGTAEGMEEDYIIELVGSLAPGMRVPCRNKRGNDDVGTLIRVLIRDGQTSLHLDADDDPMDVYLNFAGTFSPVVVVR